MEEFPLLNFHFRVEWNGDEIGFAEVSGLEAVNEVIEYRHGTSKEFSKVKLPGLTKYGNVTLKRGLYKGNKDLYNWFKQTVQSDFRRDLTISILNEIHDPVFSWNLKNAWVKSIKYGEMNSLKSEIMIETMVLAHDGMSIETTAD